MEFAHLMPMGGRRWEGRVPEQSWGDGWARGQPLSDLSKACGGNAPFILWIWGWGECIGVKRPDHSSLPDWTTFGRSPAVGDGLRGKPWKNPCSTS